MRAPITNLQLESSLPSWFPKIKDILPVPKTVILPLTEGQAYECIGLLDGEMVSDQLKAEILKAAGQIGYPLFMRTDQGSGKHNWDSTCHVESEMQVLCNIAGLMEWQMCAFRPLPQALVFRELLPLYSTFSAFRGSLPISKERRYFVDEGQVLCHHPYWPAGAIEHPDNENWQHLLNKINQEWPFEVAELTIMAKKFSEAVPGFWSVDFALAKDCKRRQWYMIDAARGELSWHPEHPVEVA